MENDLQNIHEWELAILHKEALKKENYELCDKIQKEVNRRIENDTIDKQLMQGFRYYNPKTNKFEGSPNYEGLNNLFFNY